MTQKVIRMRDLHFSPDLFRNFMSGTVLDELLCSYKGLPKGVNYMIIGDPGVGKTTIILDLLSNIRNNTPGCRIRRPSGRWLRDLRILRRIRKRMSIAWRGRRSW